MALIVVQISLGADVPFARVVIDNSIKDPWAKIIADIGADGDLDLMGANWSGPFQPVELWENRSGDSGR